MRKYTGRAGRSLEEIRDHRANSSIEAFLTAMPGFSHHLFVCGNVRAPGHRRGCCDPSGAGDLRDAFKTALKRAGLKHGVRANHAGCLDQCEHGPVVVIYPQNIWYGPVTEADVPRIVSETLVHGRVLDDLLIPDDCLNNPDCPHRA